MPDLFKAAFSLWLEFTLWFCLPAILCILYYGIRREMRRKKASQRGNVVRLNAKKYSPTKVDEFRRFVK